MIAASDLKNLAKARLDDALALSEAGRYDGAVYLAGYAIELQLKATICATLDWSGFPDTNKEFAGFQSFRTHDFDVLLRLSGVETRLKAANFVDWSVATQWSPDLRYRPVGSASQADAHAMIEATRNLLGALR
jgi:hypothetical protein